MINRRYILPASLSAVFHAALLLGFQGKTIREVVNTIEVSIPDPPPKTPEDPIPPPPANGDTTTLVKELAGGPTPPDLDPPPAGPLKRNDIVILEDNRSRNPIKRLTEIPKITGPGAGTEWTSTIGPAPIDYKGLDHLPRARVQPSPAYPTRLRQDGISGSVEVVFEVDTTGQVIRAEATRYTDREFVEPALRAVRLWRFEPGRRFGKVVPFRMTVPIEFEIER
jgi:protein TonB